VIEGLLLARCIKGVRSSPFLGLAVDFRVVSSSSEWRSRRFTGPAFDRPFQPGDLRMPNSSVKPIPEGMHTLTPHLVCADASGAIDFYKKAFGAIELVRLPGPKGKLMHGAVRIGDSVLMLVDEMPDWGSLGPKALKGSPVTIHMYVEDADAAMARAVAAGAKVTMPLADMFWGDRYGQIEDPFGHRWSIATHIRDTSPEEMQQAMANMGE
jgi:PhnB protein